MERKFQLNWQVIVEEAKQRRKSQNVTQRKLAILANVSTPTVSRFEGGEKDIQVSSALNILEVLGMLDRRNLVFLASQDDQNYYDKTSGLVIFWGQGNNGKKIQCKISSEALEDHFGEGKDKLKVFSKHRVTIEQLARRKYLENKFEADGSILVKTTDL